MKTLTLAALIGLFCLPVSAQFFEDFNAGLPGDWTLEDYYEGGSAFMWDLNDFYAFENYTGGDGYCMMGDSDAYEGWYDIGLLTPWLSGEGILTFEFDLNYQDLLTGYDFLDVDIQTEGRGWVNLASYDEDHGTFYDLPGEHVVLDVSGYAAEMVQFRFRWYDQDEYAWDWYAQIDNVEVTIPEPGLVSLAGGLLALGALAIRRR